jgi:hypothetical protein
MIANIFLNLLGIAIFFLIKFLTRTNKSEPSLSFWARDNKIELIVIGLFDVMVMALYLMGEISINFVGYLPDSIVSAGKGTGLSCAMIGLIFSFVIYTLISLKVKETEKNLKA